MVTSVSINTCKTRYSRSMERIATSTTRRVRSRIAPTFPLWTRGCGKNRIVDTGSVKDERLERRDLLVIHMEAGGSPMIQFLRRGGKVVSQLRIEISAKDVAPFRWAQFSLERF